MTSQIIPRGLLVQKDQRGKTYKRDLFTRECLKERTRHGLLSNGTPLAKFNYEREKVFSSFARYYALGSGFLWILGPWENLLTLFNREKSVRLVNDTRQII